MNITELIEKHIRVNYSPYAEEEKKQLKEFAIDLLEMVSKNTSTLIKTDAFGNCKIDRDVECSIIKALEELRK